MKQREDDNRRVRLSEFVDRFDVLDRGGQIELRQGDSLGPARGPRRVEEERHVGGVVDELRDRVGAPLGGGRESDVAGGGRQVGGLVRDVKLGSSRLGRMNRFFRHDQELRFLVGKVELELIHRVRRIKSLPKTSQ
ncbi:hypothetical protein ACFX2I_031236 [Malus domestica]